MDGTINYSGKRFLKRCSFAKRCGRKITSCKKMRFKIITEFVWTWSETCYRHGLGSKGWCSDESARLPPMCPGFKSRRRRHMWVEFVVGFLLCSERFFSGYSGFPVSSKNQHFQIPIRPGIR